MNISALLTSAGINTAVCAVLFSLYSILRKQPSLVSVYFAQRLANSGLKRRDPLSFKRLIPSASWIVKAWEASEEELYAAGGVDAVVFSSAVVFSIRVFTVAAILCLFLVLPLNYFGKEMYHKQIPDEQLIVFTIGNVKDGSRWLWAHCLSLYIITCCACVLLYFEYKKITKIRLSHITSSHSYPSHFTVTVRAIPRVSEESYNDTLTKFFSDYYASSYVSHQMVHHSGTVQKLISDAEKMCKMIKSPHREQFSGSRFMKCSLCGDTTASFKMLSKRRANIRRESSFDDTDFRKKECGAALVFFRTRYAALAASEALQSTNPMYWVTDAAPEPGDIFWSNLCVPYRILWIRRIAVIVASAFFVTFFLFPVIFTQTLVHLDKLKKIFPFLKQVIKRGIMEQLISGYLPSVVFILFLYIAPPLMYFFSTLEGAISRSRRKRSTCIKVLYFVIWNVFFANVLTEAAIDHYQVSIKKLGDTKNIPNLLAQAVPATATFFMTYVLTSGWASLSVELIQPLPLLCNFFYRYVLRNKDDSIEGAYTFPYHTEIPRLLLFGLLGFVFSILAPLMTPLLVVYFVFAFLVYRNQILNVYVTEYETGGLYWPIIHNTTIFSLILSHIIALAVFAFKAAPVTSAFILPLIVGTLLFHEYCRQRFHPIFQKTPANVVIEMDRNDEQCGRVEEIHEKVMSSYCQFKSKSFNSNTSPELDRAETSVGTERRDTPRLEDVESTSGTMSV